MSACAIKETRVETTRAVLLKLIIIREMFHNIPNTALKNIAQFINCVHFHIFILAQSVDLRTVYIMVGVQVILCNSLGLHRFPKTIIFYHTHTPFLSCFFSIIAVKSRKE